VREIRGNLPKKGAARPEVTVRYDVAGRKLWLTVQNSGGSECSLTLRPNAYAAEGASTFDLLPGRKVTQSWSVAETSGWYDLTVSAQAFERRLAGRMEMGVDSISDPAIAV
jgi:phospholipase C